MAKLVISFPPGSEISHDLPEEQITIGRQDDNTIQINDPSVSSHHAELTPEMDSFCLRDLGSTNGTRVNGENVTKRVIKDGDRLRFGQIEATFNAEKAASGEAPLPQMAEVEKPAAAGRRASGNVCECFADEPKGSRDEAEPDEDVAKPDADHPTRTTGYSQRRFVRSAMNPIAMAPNAKARLNPVSRVP